MEKAPEDLTDDELDSEIDELEKTIKEKLSDQDGEKPTLREINRLKNLKNEKKRRQNTPKFP